MDGQIECVCKSPHSHGEREAPQRWNTNNKTHFIALISVYLHNRPQVCLSQLTPAVVTKVWLAIMLYKCFVMINPFLSKALPLFCSLLSQVPPQTSLGRGFNWRRRMATVATWPSSKTSSARALGPAMSLAKNGRMLSGYLNLPVFPAHPQEQQQGAVCHQHAHPPLDLLDSCPPSC